ncbi:acyl-CoA-binding domain-containing protein 6 [Contarinia nasturtii]|uniref:acyl-CoA-binding domain-containing protein 6 n=1 Tax=Contarinia nasturtii TaxID=265458 RepID=UPI0012D38477|nr:acyl-CoA-binding domain-containing protein 6 [Contarinia nasturtii]
MDDAHFNDIFSDLDETDETETKFNKACDYLQHLVNQLDASQLLEFYGLYKQATVGPCNTSKPGIFNMNARSKWNAWNDLATMSKETAMKSYISKLNEIEPDWNQHDPSKTKKSKKPAWVSVSQPMAECDDDQHIGEKTIIDHAKEGNIDEILAHFSSSMTINKQSKAKHLPINEYDKDGLAAIHWAADRGHHQILEILLKNGANVNLIDKDSGQTALHYSISCGHLECIKILLKHGAQKNITDSDDQTPIDLANESEDPYIIELLKT